MKKKSLQSLITYYLPHAQPRPRDNCSVSPLRSPFLQSPACSFTKDHMYDLWTCCLHAGLKQESHAAWHSSDSALEKLEILTTDQQKAGSVALSSFYETLMFPAKWRSI